MTLTRILLAGLLAVPAAHAAELTNADAVLEFVLQKAGGYETLTADFAQSIGGPVQVTGTFQFKKPARTRLEMNLPVMGQQQHVVAVLGTDRVLWQEMSVVGQKNVMKIDLNTIPAGHPLAAMIKDPFENIDPQRQIARLKADYRETLTGTAELHGQGMYVLEGVLKSDAKLPPAAATARGWGKQRIHVGQQDGCLHRVEQFDASNTNQLMAIEFANLKFGEDIPDESFTYKPAPDVNVIDMTTLMLQMMRKAPGK